MSSHQRPVPEHRASAAHRAGALAALALVAAAIWAVWLGWDAEYYEVDGVAQGPYREWQVIGCGLSVAAASVVAHLRLRDRAMVVWLSAAATVGFAVPWTVHAAATDDSGLFVVGLVILVAGALIGLTVVLTVTDAVVRRLPPRMR